MEGCSGSNEVDVRGLPALDKAVEAKLLKYFQSKRLSGGGECEELTRLPGGGVRLRFKEREAMERVLARSKHSLELNEQQYLLEVRWAGDECLVKPKPIGPAAVKVEPTSAKTMTPDVCPKLPPSGIKVDKVAHLDKDFVSMYFESEKRSGGGDIASMEEEAECWIITFEDPTVGERVLKRKHSLKGHELMCVSFVGGPMAAVQRSPEYLDPWRVLLSGFTAPMNVDILRMFVENCSGTQNFQLHETDDEHCRIVTFFDDINMEYFINCCKVRGFANVVIRAEQLPITKVVRIENLKEEGSEDHLMLYLENRCGPNVQVEAAERGSTADTALIHLSSVQDVEKVLNGKWTFKGKALTAHRYYEKHRLALISLDAEEIELPNPQTISVEPRFMEFILKRPDEFDELLAQNKATFLWDNQRSPQVLQVAPALSLRTSSYVVRKKWPQDICEHIQLFLGRYSHHSERVNAHIFDDLASKILRCQTDTVEITSDERDSRVDVIGPKSEVEAVVKQLSTLKESLMAELDKIQNLAQFQLTMKQGCLDLMRQSTYDTKLQQQFPEVDMRQDLQKNTVALKGPKEVCTAMYTRLVQLCMQFSFTQLNVSQELKSFILGLNHDDFVQNTFIREGIKATIDDREGVVMVIGASVEDMTRAVGAIGKALVDTKVQFTQDFDIKQHGSDWEEFLGSLRSSDVHDGLTGADKVSFEVHCDKQVDREVVIVGLSDVTDGVVQKVKKFIADHSTETVFIPINSKGVLKYIDKFSDLHSQLPAVSKLIKEEKSDQKIGYTVTLMAKDKDEVVKHFNSLSKSIVSKKKCIQKPGGANFLHDRGTIFLEFLELRNKSIIMIEPREEQQETWQNAFRAETPHGVSAINGITVSVEKGEMQLRHADAMVNTVDKNLKIVGHLSKTLVDVGGQIIQSERDKKVASNRGPFKSGDVVLTGAGTLPCKFLINVVGIKWDVHQPPTPMLNGLKHSVTQSLKLAAEMKCQSIIIPALGTERRFGFPLALCCEAITAAVGGFCERHLEEPTSVRRVELMSIDNATVMEFKKCLRSIHDGGDRRPVARGELPLNAAESEESLAKHRHGREASASRVPHDAQQSPPGPDYKQQQRTNTMTHLQSNVYKTKSGLSMNVVKGNIENEMADVIVNTVSNNLDLSQGAVSAALLKKAGQLLQDLTWKVSKSKTLADGDAMAVRWSQPTLSCKEVYHTACCRWNSKNATKVLEQIISTCLNMASKSNYGTIAFPVIGTGFLQFPKEVTAEVFFSEVKRFGKRNPRSSLTAVRIVVHGQDEEVFRAFMAQMQKEKEKSASKTKSSASGEALHVPSPQDAAQSRDSQQDDFYTNLIDPGLGSLQMNFGKGKVLIKHGNIVKEDTEAIMNVTNSSCSIKTGVCGEILKAAGERVREEFLRKCQGAYNGVVVTDSGDLHLKKIIHLIFAKNLFTKQVYNALVVCEDVQLKSIALPAVGTGAGGLNPHESATIILDAIAEFYVQKKPKSLMEVRVVVFMEEMLQDFHRELLNRQSKPAPLQKGIMSTVTRNFQYMTSLMSGGGSEAQREIQPVSFEIEPVHVQVYSATLENVENVFMEIEKKMTTEESKLELRDAIIGEIYAKAGDEINALQKKHQVVIRAVAGDCLKIHGNITDVSQVALELQAMINKARERRQHAEEEDKLAEAVTWMFLGEDEEFTPFSKADNVALEKALRRDERRVSIRGQEVLVDFSRMNVTFERGKTFRVKRVTPADDIPLHWADENELVNQRVLIEVLKCSSKAYQQIEKEFRKSLGKVSQQPGFKVVQILSVQNRELWNLYTTKKRDMENADKASPLKTPVEKILFHGTALDTCEKINANGFNRSYCGKNAVAYGNGVYFAVSAMYSARDTYSPPDSDGIKYVYRARVLTGNYTAGSVGMLEPPPKDPIVNSVLLYDSVVDNTSRPSMFVIFNDNQAYPEHIIKFKVLSSSS
ncbi:protein mono-ADP-ribosyltransferase PARP14-like isoform X1 [Petromyzon marinus]|uniref:protein mono-ADP-ribosyltransferase PARP14-like isoform X1 n=1 Tax=Petromyzon marinus TaxID=7757 RepID=UPI003F70DBD6